MNDNSYKQVISKIRNTDIPVYQGSKLTFQPASQTGLIDCNFYQSAEKLFSPPHKQKNEKSEKMEQNKMPFSLIKD